jgi:glycosyltransferase involved in cell wall biosynthesis
MISAVILTKNEENNIAECLDTLTWCDETLLIDDESDDETVKIATTYRARVVKNPMKDFSTQRNLGLNKAKNEWVLFIDADERVSGSLRDEIIKVVAEDTNNGYLIKRKDNMWGKWLRFGETENIRLLRLGRKTKGKWVGRVHETWQVKEPVGMLKEALTHYPHPTISSFLNEINQYSTIRADELKDNGVTVSFFEIILYPKGKFFMNYILKLGFLDGIPGFISAAMMSLHSFLVRGKLWLLWQNKSAQ